MDYKHNKIKIMVFSALFAALIFTGTQFIKVPLPFGYFNFGDCFIILAALMLGGTYAIMASAIGSVLADIISGYTIYVPATLIIKSLMVVIVTVIAKTGDATNHAVKRLFKVIGVVLAELTMVLGYFLYDIVLYGIAGAGASLLGNFIQAAVAAIASIFIFTIFQKSTLIKHIHFE